MDRPLQRLGEQRRAVLAETRRDAQDDLFVADGQMALQRLTQVGDLARTLVEHNRLMEEMPFEVFADVIHLGPEQFEQLQAIVAGRQQLVEFAQTLIQLASGFADIGFRQVGDPALEVARGRFTE